MCGWFCLLICLGFGWLQVVFPGRLCCDAWLRCIGSLFVGCGFWWFVCLVALVFGCIYVVWLLFTCVLLWLHRLVWRITIALGLLWLAIVWVFM